MTACGNGGVDCNFNNDIAAPTTTDMLATIPMEQFPSWNKSCDNNKVSNGSSSLMTCMTDAFPYMNPTLVANDPTACNPDNGHQCDTLTR
mmetsp:Transcript_58445/g.142929  ORF Transcript_58445/g.142929 Transcript_58445/m.142929 type:complete len:90 (-) Transcript_58445:783-1052(-)